MMFLRHLFQFLVVALIISGGAAAGNVETANNKILEQVANSVNVAVNEAKVIGVIKDNVDGICKVATIAAGNGTSGLDCFPKGPPKKLVANCSLYSQPQPARVYGNGRIIDISHQIRGGLPNYGSSKTTGVEYLEYWFPFEVGNVNDFTQNLGVHIPIHTSSHVDAPSHAVVERQKTCSDVDTLDLDILIGPALLVDVPRDKNITADVMKALNIPRGVKRVLFRTSNTDRQLMWKPFESNYTAFTVDGAQWLVQNTDIKLVGIDYLSIAIGSHKEDVVPPHKILLEKDVIPVEALNLGGVAPGEYDLSCLPIRLLGADGAPARCILIKKP